jgi:hypothetical protein
VHVEVILVNMGGNFKILMITFRVKFDTETFLFI